MGTEEHKADRQKSVEKKLKKKGGEGNILDHIDPIPTLCLLFSPFPPPPLTGAFR
jgi:hypothetical protein